MAEKEKFRGGEREPIKRGGHKGKKGLLSDEGRPVMIRRAGMSAEEIKLVRQGLEEATQKSFEEIRQSRLKIVASAKRIMLD